MVEHRGLTLVSTMPVIWVFQSSPPSGDSSSTAAQPHDDSPLMMGAIIGVLCGVVTLLIVFILYRLHFRKKSVSD